LARLLGLWLAIGLWLLAASAGAAVTWSDVVTPAPGEPRAIGAYTAGCVQGAVALPPEGPGFQTMRLHRRRFFGHPLLARYVQALGAAAAERGLGVLAIGDMGQARGGPMPSGHRSHQTGLDVDIWFWLPPDGQALPAAARDTVAAPSMLTPDGLALDEAHWSPRHAEVLRLAADFDVVARIFVHPRIKQALCAQFPGAPWLRKIRPWWGHDDHFHVRLRCPSGETTCQDQDAPPAGDGCGDELAWWFTDEARQPPPRVDVTKVPLPAACEALLRK
jgi:penicillin-insensitive murein endopeptidase